MGVSSPSGAPAGPPTFPIPASLFVPSGALASICSLPGRCVLVGWSLGSLLALRAVLDIDEKFPEKIQTLLLYGEAGKPAKPGVEGVLKPFKAPFDFHEFKDGAYERITDPEKRAEINKAISPLYHVTKASAPTLLIHGDKDKLVPMQQSGVMIAKLKEAGVPCELVVKTGADHGWTGIDKDMTTIADWFDKYLAKKEKGSP
jgi:acetyl esterase/lipase